MVHYVGEEANALAEFVANNWVQLCFRSDTTCNALLRPRRLLIVLHAEEVINILQTVVEPLDLKLKLEVNVLGGDLRRHAVLDPWELHRDVGLTCHDLHLVIREPLLLFFDNDG